MDSLRYPIFGNASAFYKENVERTERLFAAINEADWDEVIGILEGDSEIVNIPSFQSATLNTPLHQCALKKAPEHIFEYLIEAKALVTLKNADGKMAFELAKEIGTDEIAELITPKYKRHIPEDHLQKLEANLHRAILSRAASLVDNNGLRLPQISVLLSDYDSFYFAVPGMYGGFHVELIGEGTEAHIRAESWCRVVEGSEETHVITADGFEKLQRDQPEWILRVNYERK